MTDQDRLTLIDLSQLPTPALTWSNDLQVSGNQYFPEERWREAVLYFLNGIWGDKQAVTYRPKIMFGGITLRLDAEDGMYYAYGTPSYDLPEHIFPFTGEERVIVGCRKEDVEVALMRFVKNDRIQQLIICLQLGSMTLEKKPRRGQYLVSAAGLPRSWGVAGPIW